MTPAQEHLLLDCIRFVFFLSSAAAVGLALTLAVGYARAYLGHRKANEEPWRRLLPLHVTVVAASYLLFVFMAVFEVAGRLDWDTIHWRTPVLMVASVLGAFAMFIILRFSRHSREDVSSRLSKQD